MPSGLSSSRAAAVLALLLATVPAGPAAAQVVRGRVLTEGGRAPVAEAIVHLETTAGAPAGAPQRSDSLGRFHLVAREPGWYVLAARRIGYRPVRSESLWVREPEVLAVDVTLSATTDQLEPVVITARRRIDARTILAVEGFEWRRSIMSGRFLTDEDLRLMGASAAIDAVGAGLPFTSLIRRGGEQAIQLDAGRNKGCMPLIYIDGVLITQNAAERLSQIPTAHIHGIEYYDDEVSIPPEFPGTFHRPCAALAVWRKRGG